jgi:uncharacterized protein (TIGR02145 family)
MRAIVIFFFLCFLANQNVGQILHKRESNAGSKPVQKPKPASNKSSTTVVPLSKDVQMLLFEADSPCSVFVDGEKKGSIIGDNMIKVPLSKGNHKFKFISTEFPNATHTEEYEVDDEEIGSSSIFKIDLSEQIDHQKRKIEIKRSQKKVDERVRSERKEGSMTDQEGHIYKTIKLAGQEWMAENLNTSTYRNGDAILTGLFGEDWIKVTTGAWSYYGYENASSNGEALGKLYNWLAVNDPRGLCPVGWHVPSDKELEVLINYLGGKALAYGALKSTSTMWEGPNALATNSSGFSGLPGGSRNGHDFEISETSPGGFSGFGEESLWWLRDYHGSKMAGCFWLDHADIECTSGGTTILDGNYVRCLKDNSEFTAKEKQKEKLLQDLVGRLNGNNTAGSITDKEGKIYKTVKIGSQEWMAQNLNTSVYRNGDPISTTIDEKSKSGGYVFYNNDASNGSKFGRLYNWYAIADPRGLCPTGWHVPSDSEWDILINNLGGKEIAGGLMKSISPSWTFPVGSSSNISGFSALPCGEFDPTWWSTGDFAGGGLSSSWWSGSAMGAEHANRYQLNNLSNGIWSWNGNGLGWEKYKGFSVRCLRD